MKLLWTFILFLPLLASPAHAWNPDYAYGLPQERRMCVQRDTDDRIRFLSIAEDEDCPPGSRRYIVIFAKEPRGAMALIATTTSLSYYPPLTLNWPAQEPHSGSPLWHFTCLQKHELVPLGTKLSLKSYRGEMTFPGKLDCLAAEQSALKYCQEEWHGEALLENCPISWGSQ